MSTPSPNGLPTKPIPRQNPPPIAVVRAEVAAAVPVPALALAALAPVPAADAKPEMDDVFPFESLD